jgi:flagellar M-ring protein FliF
LLYGEQIPISSLQAMEQAFGKANLTSYSVEGSKIRVPRSQRGAYMGALADANALPPIFGDALNRALEKGSPFESPQQREARIQHAREEELSLIVRSMPGIESASVMVDVDVKPGLNLTHDKIGTASVSVKPMGTTSLDESRVTSIVQLVAAARLGIQPEHVTVTDLNSGISRHGVPEGIGGGASTYADAKSRYEKELKSKVLNALGYIPGVGVETTIVLDTQQSSQSESLKNDPKPVPRRRAEKSKTVSEEGSGPGGRPGLATQGNTPMSLASAAASSSSKGTHKEEETSDVEEVNDISTVREIKQTVGLTPKLAKVSVGVPESYFAKVWRERNPPADNGEQKLPDQAALKPIRDQEVQSIRKQVAGLLPPAEGVSDLAELVTVTTFSDIQRGEIPVPGLAQSALGWFGQNWGTLAIAGLVLVSLNMLRSMVRAAPAAPEPSTTSLRVAAEPEPKEEDTAEAAAARRLRRMTGSGPSLRDELSDLVKEDPDAAANILRAWIGQVS